MDSVARGVRFWQLVRLGVGGRAWASLICVFGGDVGRAGMSCWRSDYRGFGALLASRGTCVTTFRGGLWRQELVGNVLLWGREAGGGRSVVCIPPRGLRFRRFAKTLGGCCGTRSAVWACEPDGPSCNKDLMRMPGAESAFDGLVYARRLFQAVHLSGQKGGKAWFQGGRAWFA